MIASTLALLISAILYRVPRGGPDGHVWKRWIGFAPGSRVGASVWAGVTALVLVFVTGTPWWCAPIVFLWLSYAESSAYMHLVSETSVDVKGLTKRGLILFNPLMGVIYEAARRYTKRWPLKPPLVDGWTAYAELGCGLATAIGTLIVLTLIGSVS